MRNVRRHLRLNMVVPTVIRLAEKGSVISIPVEELNDPAWRQKALNLDNETKLKLDRLALENQVAAKVLFDLMQRLSVITQGVACIVQGLIADDFTVPQYQHFRNTPALATHLKPSGVTSLLLRAFNEKLVFYFELIDMASHQHYAKFYELTKQVAFDFDDLMQKVMAKPTGENLLADVLLLLEDKLKLYVALVARFKQEVEYLLDPNSWPLRPVNLSQGGIGFTSTEAYPKFARLIIQLRMGRSKFPHKFDLTGNIVSVRPVGEHSYIAVEFTNLTEKQQTLLEDYIQLEELDQAIEYLNKKNSLQLSGDADAGLL